MGEDFKLINAKRKKQSGSGLVVMLIMAAVLSAAMATSLLETTGVASMLAKNSAASVIVAQASVIRSRLLQCATDYPAGTNGGVYRVSYPRADTATAVSSLSLTCPGNGLGLWNTPDSVAAPVAPSGFGAWYYTNDATSQRISVTTSGADAASLLASVVGRLGAQASQSGVSPTVTLTWVISN